MYLMLQILQKVRTPFLPDSEMLMIKLFCDWSNSYLQTSKFFDDGAYFWKGGYSKTTRAVQNFSCIIHR